MDKLHGESHDPTGTEELIIDLKYSVASSSGSAFTSTWGCTDIAPGQVLGADTAPKRGAGMDTAGLCFSSPD